VPFRSVPSVKNYFHGTHGPDQHQACRAVPFAECVLYPQDAGLNGRPVMAVLQTVSLRDQRLSCHDVTAVQISGVRVGRPGRTGLATAYLLWLVNLRSADERPRHTHPWTSWCSTVFIACGDKKRRHQGGPMLSQDRCPARSALAKINGVTPNAAVVVSRLTSWSASSFK
jgi:hypothetical protein